LVPHLVVALAGDRVLAVAPVRSRKLTAMLLSLLRLGLPVRALPNPQVVCPGLSRVQTAKAKHLLAVPMPVVLYRDDFVRRLCRACLVHAQRLMAIRLTRALLLLSMARDRVCHEGQA
jgi:hypothetical protein